MVSHRYTTIKEYNQSIIMRKSDSYNQRLLESIKTGKPMATPVKRDDAKLGPTESQIQQTCITWFRYQYPSLWNDGVLFHIPNEGVRIGATGKRMKSEGIVRGVADLCLAVPRHGYAALYIEMKRPKCYQSPHQKAWEHGVTKHGNKYVVCKSFEEFQMIINRYLQQ